MEFTVKGCRIFSQAENRFVTGDLSVREGAISAEAAGAPVFEFDGCYLMPGFVDVHVHLREPGFSYKETIASGTGAAARGGFTTVCPMPNLDPVPDSAETLEAQLFLIRRDAVVRVVPYGAITRGEKGERLSDLAAMAPYVCGFSDDGKGVQSAALMKEAMLRAKSLGRIIAAHCEDNSLLNGGCIHDGEYARCHGYAGISSASEWRAVERDLRLVEETGCAYHVCHVSTKESVALIRAAKRQGLDVTCETAPHYLALDDSMLEEDGRFKMNPPIRSRSDREALIGGLLDGTVDMIATDHAPHSADEKSRGLKGSLMGVVGLETAFPVLYTELVKTNVLPLERLVALMSANPARRFGFRSGLDEGMPADFTVFDLNSEYAVDPDDFLSRGRATPFDGKRVFGECLMTVCGGRIVWRKRGEPA
ncbi:MAG: dihydroorotase [Clostridia bacterium]|nr:dihydroorotase [Clostridia bacterium]